MKKRNEEANFFNMLIESGNQTRQIASALCEMMENYVNVDAKADAIRKQEHDAGIYYRNTYQALSLAFITPIEREDILGIASFIYDIIDAIEDIANMLNVLNVEKIQQRAKELVQLIVKACNDLAEAMEQFKDYKKSKTLLHIVAKIKATEEVADLVYRSAVKELYSSGSQVLYIMQWKEIYDKLEEVTDLCDDAGHLIEMAALKNS